MELRSSVTKIGAGALLAASLIIGGTATSMATTVQFTIHNYFGTAITLDQSSCTSGTITAPYSIANNGSATFTGTTTNTTTLCTVRYQSGNFGCQFKVQALQSGGSYTGFIANSAYKGAGGRPSCDGTGQSNATGYQGDFTMQ